MGRWITCKGRKIFIEDGESVESAMMRNGMGSDSSSSNQSKESSSSSNGSKQQGTQSKEEKIKELEDTIKNGTFRERMAAKRELQALKEGKTVEQLKKERKRLQERIRTITKWDNDVVAELHECISAYAKELEVSEIYMAPNKDYIFTDDLKSLSGTILHKIVFSFKLAYIKLIKEKTRIVLPIVLDSPSGREVEHSTVETMLKIVQRDYPEHQLIVASIYDYDLKDKKIIEFKDRLFNTTDMMMMK